MIFVMFEIVCTGEEVKKVFISREFLTKKLLLNCVNINSVQLSFNKLLYEL